MYVDTHCHLNDERFDADRDAVVERMREKKVGRCVTIGCDLSSSLNCLILASRYAGVYASCGIHPHSAEQAPKDFPDRLAELLGDPRAVALGEIGLDYHYTFSSRESQARVLEIQLEMAWQLGLPAVIHVREAHGDMLRILRGRRGRQPGGILHCYSGSLESAREYLDLGYHISFSGSVTFANAVRLREVAASVPADRILAETDSPFLSPVPLRGRRNEPGNVVLVSDLMAGLRGVGPEDFARQCTDNALKLFGIASAP